MKYISLGLFFLSLIFRIEITNSFNLIFSSAIKIIFSPNLSHFILSIKKNLFGKDKDVLFVKGSGWDMSNLNERGLPGLYLDPLLKTLSLKKMSDEKMVNYLRSNLLDSSSPNPSIETLLHAYLPFKYLNGPVPEIIGTFIAIDLLVSKFKT